MGRSLRTPRMDGMCSGAKTASQCISTRTTPLAKSKDLMLIFPVSVKHICRSCGLGSIPRPRGSSPAILKSSSFDTFSDGSPCGEAQAAAYFLQFTCLYVALSCRIGGRWRWMTARALFLLLMWRSWTPTSPLLGRISWTSMAALHCVRIKLTTSKKVFPF